MTDSGVGSSEVSYSILKHVNLEININQWSYVYHIYLQKIPGKNISKIKKDKPLYLEE